MACQPHPPTTAPAAGQQELALRVPIATMRQPIRQGHSRPLAWRLLQLERLATLLREGEAAMADALASDLGKPPLEALFETIAVTTELRHTRRHLGRWLRPQGLPLAPWALPGRAAVQTEPLGCVLIISPWNYPLQLCLQPLVHALAAGNSVVLKPSEHAPATATLLARLIADHFPAEVVQVVLGESEVAARLLEEQFDHIFFTGGTGVGRLVMAAAARHLTPVTLELGGKCPAIVLADADIAITARRLLWGKSINAGQTCVAPDHVLVERSVRQPLIEAMARELTRFHGDDPLSSGDLGRIINARQFERLESLLAGARARGQVLIGGRSDAATLKIEPTLLDVSDADGDPLMQEELFGPLLPLITIDDLEEALARLRQAASPLAIYLFSDDRQAQERLLAGSRSGSVAFNDVVIQAGMTALPFGGVGESGMGAYHGETGLRTFSQQRTVLRRALRPDINLRYPPYRGRLSLMRRLLSWG